MPNMTKAPAITTPAKPKVKSPLAVRLEANGASPGVVKAVETAADRRNYANRKAGWPAKE